MGDIRRTRGHKRSPRIRSFSQTSPRIRPPPNHLIENQNVQSPTTACIVAVAYKRHHPDDGGILLRATTSLPPRDTMMLSPGELTIMFQSEGFAPKVADTFTDNPHLSMTLQHFSFLSFSIQHLEMNAERHRQELEDIFGPLSHRKRFCERMAPLITAYRQQKMGTRIIPTAVPHLQSPLCPIQKVTTLPQATNPSLLVDR